MTLRGAPTRRTEDLRGVVVRIRVSPESPIERIALYQDGTYRAWVRSGPDPGLANARLCALLARLCGARREAIEILSGRRMPWKVVRIPGVTREEFDSRIPKRRGGFRFAPVAARAESGRRSLRRRVAVSHRRQRS